MTGSSAFAIWCTARPIPTGSRAPGSTRDSPFWRSCRNTAVDFVSNLPRHLERVPTISEQHPGLRIVIDHLAKPPIGAGDVEPWWSLSARRGGAEPLVERQDCSGLYPDSGEWTVRRNSRRFVDRALGVAGTERLMFGGDWPFLGGQRRLRPRVRRPAVRAVRPLRRGRNARNVWSDTARRVYRIEPARLEAARSASLASSPPDPGPDIRG